jgi:hypothetical protein
VPCLQSPEAAEVANNAKHWATTKPLAPLFGDLARVVLVDDEADKAGVGEEANLLVVPHWEPSTAPVRTHRQADTDRQEWMRTCREMWRPANAKVQWLGGSPSLQCLVPMS